MDEAVVDKIVARVMALANGEAVDTGPRRVLALFSGAPCGFAPGQEALRRLAASAHQVKAMLTPSARRMLPEDEIRKTGVAAFVPADPWLDVPALLAETDIVLVPGLTMKLCARIALGLMDGPDSTLVLGARLAGKPVLAIRNGADPAGPRGHVLGARPDGAPALWNLLQRHLDTLAGFGIELVDQDAFLPALERVLIRVPARAPATDPATRTPAQSATAQPAPGQPAPGQPATVRPVTAGTFVTARDLIGLAPGSVLRLSPGRRLTAQAQETASRLRLVVETVRGQTA